MGQQSKKIDYISIDCDSNYFDTKEQIVIRNTSYFSDRYASTRLSGSNSSVGHFSTNGPIKNRLTSGSLSPHPVITSSIDPSGNNRKILSSDVDLFSSGSIDTYRNGVEISQDKHWIAGLAKVSAGTPGHIFDNPRYGIIDIDVLESLYVSNTSSIDASGSDRELLDTSAIEKVYKDVSGNDRKIFSTLSPANVFTEIETFNPVSYVESGELLTYPIITKDSNQSENLILNGIIEPLTIRPIVSNYSINFPIEPHTVKGDFGNGNLNHRLASDSVTSVDYFLPKINNKAAFLDAYDAPEINAQTELGLFSEFLLLDENFLQSYVDEVFPRGQKINSASYGEQLSTAVSGFKPEGTTYVTSAETSARCGFIFGDTQGGCDSVTYGDMSYGQNRDNRRRKRTIISIRDSAPFVTQNSTNFDDTNTIQFVSQVIEYPSMLPANYSGSMINNSVRSELFKTGAIQVTGVNKPGSFDFVLRDAVLSAVNRAGSL